MALLSCLLHLPGLNSASRRRNKHTTAPHVHILQKFDLLEKAYYLHLFRVIQQQQHSSSAAQLGIKGLSAELETRHIDQETGDAARWPFANREGISHLLFCKAEVRT